MKNKKGFTLIELLAVIIILAIIALIAVPIILNVIEKAKQESAIDSAYGYIDAVEKSVAIGNINQDKGITIPSDNELKLGDIDDTLILDKISVKGKKPDYIEMTFEKGKVKTAGFCVDNYNVEYKDKKANISSTNYCEFANVESIEIEADDDIKDKIQKKDDNTYNLTLTSGNELDLNKLNIKATTKDVENINPTIVVGNENVIEKQDNKILAKSLGSTYILIQAGIKYIKINVNVINDSLLGYLEQKTYSQYDNIENINAKYETYPAHVYYFEGDQTWAEDIKFGSEEDVGTASEDAKRMVIVKVDGDLTINSGVTVSPYYNSSYGGPKGFLLYVTGTLTNNGTIDNSHGAKAVGQDVYLWQNSDDSFEFVPAIGAAGGASVRRTSDGCTNGVVGASTETRQTGGGGGGAACRWAYATSISGTGGQGTSYSGGTGGGSTSTRSGTTTGNNGAANGGTGGNGVTKRNNSTKYSAGGGAGNPGGYGSLNNSTTTSFSGSNGTGGLLIIYANEFINNNIISANGTVGGVDGTYHAAGGSSGGGSINIFYHIKNENTGIIQANGGSAIYNGGAGGNGTVTIGKIENNQFQKD